MKPLTMSEEREAEIRFLSCTAKIKKELFREIDALREALAKSENRVAQLGKYCAAAADDYNGMLRLFEQPDVRNIFKKTADELRASSKFSRAVVEGNENFAEFDQELVETKQRLRAAVADLERVTKERDEARAALTAANVRESSAIASRGYNLAKDAAAFDDLRRDRDRLAELLNSICDRVSELNSGITLEVAASQITLPPTQEKAAEAARGADWSGPVAVAQQVERGDVAPVGVGSIPTGHPNSKTPPPGEFGEPWRHDRIWDDTFDRCELSIGGRGNETHRYWERAVACVNALSGIPDPEAFVREAKEVSGREWAAIEKVIKTADEYFIGGLTPGQACIDALKALAALREGRKA